MEVFVKIDAFCDEGEINTLLPEVLASLNSHLPGQSEITSLTASGKWVKCVSRDQGEQFSNAGFYLQGLVAGFLIAKGIEII